MASSFLGRIMGKSEPLDEWDVVEIPSQDEMKSFRGTAPDPSLAYTPGHNTIASNGGQLGGCGRPGTAVGPSTRFTGTKEEVCPDCNTHHKYFKLGKVFEVSWHGDASAAREEEKVSSEPAKHKQEFSQTPPSGSQLQPCSSCHSYHYISSCIYLLPWEEWLDYHLTHMPSQPFPYKNLDDQKPRANSGSTPSFLKEDELDVLRSKASSLDQTEVINRPNYISRTKLKADLMTRSSRDMWYEDEEWEMRLKRRDHNRPDSRWRDEEDELALLRAELGRKLPRTSKATIFDDTLY